MVFSAASSPSPAQDAEFLLQRVRERLTTWTPISYHAGSSLQLAPGALGEMVIFRIVSSSISMENSGATRRSMYSPTGGPGNGWRQGRQDASGQGLPKREVSVYPDGAQSQKVVEVVAHQIDDNLAAFQCPDDEQRAAEAGGLECLGPWRASPAPGKRSKQKPGKTTAGLRIQFANPSSIHIYYTRMESKLIEVSVSNCSSSVEPFSAAVENSTRLMVWATASK